MTITSEQYQNLIALIHECDERQLDGVFQAFRGRRGVLGSIRAASLTVGAQVKTDNLKPKYLNGLKGEVVSIEGKSCTILLDEESTATLKYSSSRYYNLSAQRHRFPGIPTQCAVVQSNG